MRVLSIIWYFCEKIFDRFPTPKPFQSTSLDLKCVMLFSSNPLGKYCQEYLLANVKSIGLTVAELEILLTSACALRCALIDLTFPGGILGYTRFLVKGYWKCA